MMMMIMIEMTLMRGMLLIADDENVVDDDDIHPKSAKNWRGPFVSPENWRKKCVNLTK